MLLQSNFTEKHIRELQESSRRDPVLLERAVYAFGLLEALVRVGMPFVFKGGTCLMLLLKEPRRLSTDIDIIVDPGTDLKEYLQKASRIFPFRDVEEQIRMGKNNIEKRHFKFTYDSPINGRPFYILLDVLFEENHYTSLTLQNICNELLLSEPEYLPVKVPAIDCVLADKLTAFAPHTTGIPLNIGKDMEVMKQFYDICSLIDVLSDLRVVRNTYNKVSLAEIAYRDITATPRDCLLDTFDAALCIASHGREGKQSEYSAYVDGIQRVRSHIFAKNYTAEIAAGEAAKVLYLIACLLSGEEFTPVTDYRAFIDQQFKKGSRLSSLRYLRKVFPESYAYAIKADRFI